MSDVQDQQRPAQGEQSQDEGTPPDRAGQQNEEQSANQKQVDPRAKARRLLIGGVVLVVVLLGILLWCLHARNFEDTDDAEVDGHLHPIAARVDGTVTAVYAEDNQPVHAGDLLVQLDPRDYQVSLEQARTAYAQAKGQAQAQDPNLPITSISNATNVSTGQTEVATAVAALAGAQQDKEGVLAQLRQAEANNDKAQMDLQRYTRLLARSEVSQQDYDQYLATAKADAATVEQQQASLNSSEKNIEQKQAQLDEQRVRLKQSQINAPRQIAIQKANIASSQANAGNAMAKMDQAALNLQYTQIHAPVSGIAAQRSAETGEKVSVGQQLMMIVQTDDLWVTANFRETQLRNMRVGQHVTARVSCLQRTPQAITSRSYNAFQCVFVSKKINRVWTVSGQACLSNPRFRFANLIAVTATKGPGMEIAKWLVAFVALFNFGGWIADAVVPFTARQHIGNPRWPPHAKFHDGQTMFIGVGLGSLSLFLLFASGPLTPMHFGVAAFTASLYFIAMLLAPLFPGTAWSDPEFTKENGTVLGLHPQLFVGLVLTSITVIACLLVYVNSRK